MTKKRIAIIGGGPAAMSAAVYAQEHVETLFFTDKPGGQITTSDEVNNWLGMPGSTGQELADQWFSHLKKSSVDLRHGELIESIQKESDNVFTLITDIGDEYTANGLLIATGADYRKLDVPGEDQNHVFRCAICDGAKFKNGRAIVIGGGDSANQVVRSLVKEQNCFITQVIRDNQLHGHADIIKDLNQLPSAMYELITNAQVVELQGKGIANEVVYEVESQQYTVHADGVFVNIGLVPASSLVQHLVSLNDKNEIRVDPTTMSACSGVYAAGDVCDGDKYKQAIIAAGQGAKAMLELLKWVQGEAYASPCDTNQNM
ncbi:MAG: NAD(P)/FAD-dependent oxidoreductase [Desulfohalobiaceae bacterium]